jgi:hypothetical protein
MNKTNSKCANMTTFKMRAESFYDALKFTETFYDNKGDIIDMQITSFREYSLGGCELEITTTHSLESIQKILNSLSDSHVMSETLAPIDDYTGVRVRV